MKNADEKKRGLAALFLAAMTKKITTSVLANHVRGSSRCHNPSAFLALAE
jgi:hypothetical protein